MFSSKMGAMKVSTAQMPTQREYLLQTLPAEAVILILEGLGFRDLMALRVTCRALSEWLPHATRYSKPPHRAELYRGTPAASAEYDCLARRIQATIYVPNRGGPTINSLAWIIARCQYVSSQS